MIYFKTRYCQRLTGDDVRVKFEPYTGASRCFSPADMAGCRTRRVKTRRERNGAAESTAPFFISSTTANGRAFWEREPDSDGV